MMSTTEFNECAFIKTATGFISWTEEGDDYEFHTQ